MGKEKRSPVRIQAKSLTYIDLGGTVEMWKRVLYGNGYVLEAKGRFCG